MERFYAPISFMERVEFFGTAIIIQFFYFFKGMRIKVFAVWNPPFEDLRVTLENPLTFH